MYDFSDMTIIKRACNEVFDSETSGFDDVPNEYLDVTLSTEQIDILSERISTLPNDYQEALLARLCFGLSADEIGKIFNMTDFKRAFAGACTVLAYSVPLEDGKRISMESLRKASEKALSAFVSDVYATTKKSSGNANVDKLKGFIRRQRRKVFAAFVLRYAAIFFIGIILSATITLTVSAELRERFFSWMISVYEKYSSFGITSDEIVELPALSRLRVYYNYLPEGFAYKEESINDTTLQVIYENREGKQIILTITPSDTIKQDFGADIIVWEDIGFSLSLKADLDHQTALLIAENAELSVTTMTADLSGLQILLNYIPANFELTEETDTEIRRRIRYENQNGLHISITATLPDATQDLNTEGVVPESILVNEHEAIRWRNNNTEFIVWEQQDYMLSLITELNQEIALKIAKNIQIMQ